MAVVTFIIYLFSLCPTVYLIDSGELAAVSYTLGIAHPTGYPLYTIISYFFAHLPGEPVFNLNLLSALFTVCAAVFLYVLSYGIIKDKSAALIPVAIFSFAPTIWRISVTNEVYPLTALFGIMIFYVLYRLRDIRRFYLIMYLVGLAFTNHIIVFSLAVPVFAYLMLKYKPEFKKVLFGIICALFAVSLYVYLIARTNGNAALAWGNTHNLQRLFWHVTGKQYQVWMFSQSITELLRNFGNGLMILLRNFLYVLIVPVLLGFYCLFKSERGRFWLFISIPLLNILYVINYSIPDIESYCIPGFITLTIVSAYGLKVFKKYLKLYVILPLVIIIVLLNYRTCTLRGNSFGMDFGHAHLEQLPEKSLLLCTFWDIYSPTIYLRKVKNTNTDLIVIDKELLRRTWYIKYLQDEYPEFYNGVSVAVDDYLIELRKFEYGKPYNPKVIQMKFIRMLEAFVNNRIQKGVYFATPFPDRDLDQTYPQYLRIPKGLVFELRSDTVEYHSFDFSKLQIRKPGIVNDERLEHNITGVRRMVNNNILYLDATGMTEASKQARIWLKDF